MVADNRLRPAGLAATAAALKLNAAITSVNLEGECGSRVAPCSLLTVFVACERAVRRFPGNNIGSEGASAFAQAMKESATVASVNFAGERRMTAEGALAH